jgi:hypothetical protein
LNQRTEGARFEVDRASEGYVLYQRLGCPRCHGNTLQGTHKAPSLREVAKHYDQNGIAQYLANPDSAQQVDPRLSRLNEEYSKHEMPSFPLHPEASETLANFLLAPTSGGNADVNDEQNLQQ